MTKNNTGTIEIMNPVGEFSGGGRKLSALIPGVAGTTVGFRVQWPSFDIFMNRMGELLTGEHAVKKVETMFTGSDGTAAGKVTIRGRADAQSWTKAYDELAAKIDWGIFGLAA